MVSPHADGPTYLNFRFIFLVALDICCAEGRGSRTKSFSLPFPFILFFSANGARSFIRGPRVSARHLSDTISISALVAVETRHALSLFLSVSLLYSFSLEDLSLEISSVSRTRTITAHTSAYTRSVIRAAASSFLIFTLRRQKGLDAVFILFLLDCSRSSIVFV